MDDTKENKIKISVRNLVEFILRCGDLDSRFMGSSRAVEGTRAHQKIQKETKEGYLAEVSLKYTTSYKNFTFEIEGRADGIITNENSITIDEIKTTGRPINLIEEEYNMLHWAQAKCYAFIYASENSLQEINVQLTYYQIETEEIKRFLKKFKFTDLNTFFYDLLDKYIVWAELTYNWNVIRNASIKSLNFPFQNYRKGQRQLAVSVYQTIKENKNFFAQAPTGIGKTISTLFPAVKSIGEDITLKVFYLTAKTITRNVALEAVVKMHSNGLRLKTIALTAKEKICFKEETVCNPDDCEYAKGHFDRVNDALIDILNNEDIFTRDIIESYAKKHKVCPFEYSLDLTLWSDCIICDYNYVFDPRVYLKRFFTDGGGEYTFLIDEAHNLVDRAREMFSAEIYKKSFLHLRNALKDSEPKIAKVLNKINTIFREIKKACNNDDFIIFDEEQKEIYKSLQKFVNLAEEYLTKNEKNDFYEELLELYFSSFNYLKISELYDNHYVTYAEKVNEDVKLKLFCLDPSYLLSEAIKRGKSAIFFSATLTPINYFKRILGGNEKDYTLRLASPFSEDNRSIIICSNISTRYNDREKGYPSISEYIYYSALGKTGNYMVFFPSYKYMNEVYNHFKVIYPNMECIIQDSTMNEEEREKFLNQFKENPENTMIGFCVLGGLFSEGIDLKKDRLIGAIIVGVGLPQICLERNIIRNFFEKDESLGYEYAYMYPGMNKVLQAAGRVIRSEEDKGIIVLLDDRFLQKKYLELFPREWFSFASIRNKDDIIKNIDQFWSKHCLK